MIMQNVSLFIAGHIFIENNKWWNAVSILLVLFSAVSFIILISFGLRSNTNKKDESNEKNSGDENAVDIFF